MKSKPTRALYNLILFMSIMLFLAGSFFSAGGVVGTVAISLFSSLMLLAATYAIRDRSRYLLLFAFGVIIFKEGSAFFLHFKYLDWLASLATVGFFLYIVYHLVRQVARSKEVSLDVILESVNGYLLVGLSGSVLFALTSSIQENAFAFATEGTRSLSDFIYFGFITMTTIGYGEITPLTGLARLLAIILGISGQLYIAIIIATLVGKYLSQQTNRP
jgi:voltage-gated potassium channel